MRACELAEFIQHEFSVRFDDDGDEVRAGGGAPLCGGPPPVPTLFEVFGDDDVSEKGISLPVSSVGFSEPLQQAVTDACREHLGRVRACLPPISNTGVELTDSVHLHWLKLSIWKDVESIVHVLADELRLCPDRGPFDDVLADFPVAEYGTRNYQTLRVGPNGISIQSGNRSGLSEEVLVNIPGEAIDVYGHHAVMQFVRRITEAGWKWRSSRVDVAFDQVPFTPLKFYAELKRGNYRSTAKSEEVDGVKKAPVDFRQNWEGTTVYWGKRQSQRMLRCYDRRGFTRLEMELKGDAALRFLCYCVASPSENFRALAMLELRMYLDLVKRDASANASRCPLLPWWKAFIGEVQRVKRSVENTIKSVADVAEARAGDVVRVVKQIGRRVATLVEVLGQENFESVVQTYKGKLGMADRLRVRSTRAAVERNCEIFGENVKEFFARALGRGVICSP